jgi:hypothetical protein
MPALVAGIHAFLRIKQGVDGRDKPGHDVADSSSQKITEANDERRGRHC